MNHTEGSKKLLNVVYAGVNGLSRLANCRVKSSNLYLKVWRGDVVQKGGRKNGETSPKE